MKNKIAKNFFLIIIFLSFFLKDSYSKDLEFTATKLEILENGNLLVGEGGVKVISDDQTLEADKFKYNKIDLHLELIGNVVAVNSSDNTVITGNKIDYFKNQEKFISTGDVEIKISDKYTINSSNLTYFKIKEHFFSKDQTVFKDKIGNKFELKNFNYLKLKNEIKGKKIKYTDIQLNEYFIEDAMVNLESNEIIGKDLKIDFTNSAFGNPNNEPRLKGNKLYSNNNLTTVSKGIFTTCKKTDQCPPWSMQASEIKHDKAKKTIYYKNAWLKIYDKPVVYFPKFFHPDPTVKRQSGFLIPKFSQTNTLGTALQIPYFKVISENKDLTFTPRLYVDGSTVLQSEYREKRGNSSHILDFSIFTKESLNIFDNDDQKNHFFSNSVFNYDFEKFSDSTLEINIETVSNPTYLKTYKIESPLINNETSLNSFVNLEMSNEDTYVKTSFESYEDLNKDKDEKYEFVYPNIELEKRISLNPEYHGTLNFDLQGYQKKYGADSFDSVLVNNLEYESFDYILNSGLKNKFNLLLKNVNSNGDNSTVNRDKTSNKLLGSFIFESSYPLKKIGENFNSFLKPTASIRYSPTETKNISGQDRRININNIFSNNRISNNNTIEGGQSLTVGSEYSLTKKDNNDEFLLLNLATVVRDEENPDLPQNSTIGEKTSDIVGNAKYKPNKYFNIDYNFSIDSSLDTSNYDSIKTNFSLNNFVTTFEFLQEQNIIGSKSYIKNETSYSFDGSNSLSFSTRKNKETNLTEFYNLIYEYKNDCLAAAIEYNKEYYNDNDLKPEEQLLFTITIMPFGKVGSPTIYR